MIKQIYMGFINITMILHLFDTYRWLVHIVFHAGFRIPEGAVAGILID